MPETIYKERSNDTRYVHVHVITVLLNNTVSAPLLLS